MAGQDAYGCTADVPHAIVTSASSRWLAAMGFSEDGVIAVEEDTCTIVPLRDVDGALAPTA